MDSAGSFPGAEGELLSLGLGVEGPRPTRRLKKRGLEVVPLLCFQAAPPLVLLEVH